jgi:FixJ family two-component response regulator
MPKKPVISVIDDDVSVREGTVDLLNSMGFIAKPFQRADDFLKSNCHPSTSCLIADVRMPGMSGLELHNCLVGSGNLIPTILITAFPNDRDRERALQAGVKCYLTKPFKEDDLLACIRTALEYRGAGGRES